MIKLEHKLKLAAWKDVDIVQEIVFSQKQTNGTFDQVSWKFPLQKPMICPHCNAYEDGTVLSKNHWPYIDECYIGVVVYRCTHCRKPYLVTYTIDPKAKKTTFEQFFPSYHAEEYKNELIAETSPRFIDSYNQALRAESINDFELAAIGYRHALECLVKDYAMAELKKEREEVIGKTLANAIGEYLGENELIATADVVRILGNDYAHYERKYPQHDFALLKNYMRVFIGLVETKLMIRHPPVKRKEQPK